MTDVVVRHIPVKNRLASLIKVPGGKKLKDAVADAERNLEAVRPDCVGRIDELIYEIQLLSGAVGDPGLETRQRLYDLANQIVSIAGTFSLPGVGRAAYSLCEMIDCTIETGGCTRGEVLVHVESLQLLRHPERLGAAGEAAVLDGLAKIIRHAQVRVERAAIA
ncbi:MAG TPA: hypothetical protein VG407_14730 [Caulobacteraceae bacterium]|jgi:hypothetical protein|nr:hypothetical protein [Caulobacteraceae bacterium]